MNKKLLIVFAIGVVAYIVWKKMNEETDGQSEGTPSPKIPTPAEIKAMKKTRSGATTMGGATQYKANLGSLGSVNTNVPIQSRK